MRMLRSGWVAGLVLAASASVANAEIVYRVIDLGIMGTSSTGWRANNAGQVTGTWSAAGTHGFIYDHGKMTDLATLGGTQTFANDINSEGVVVGQSLTSTGVGQAFMYKDGTMTALAGMSDGASAAYGINAAGVIVGSVTAADGKTHAFSYSGGVMTDLGISGSNVGSSIAKAINTDGVIAGEYVFLNQTHAFTFKNGTLTDVGTLGGSKVVVNDISDSGVVIGWSTLVDSQQRGFYYDGQIHSITTLGGSRSQANGVNSAGQIVGASLTADRVTHGFLFEDGQIVDLNDKLFPGTECMVTSASDINDDGFIVGTGIINKKMHAVMLQPVPLPSSLLMGLGLLVCVGFGTMYRRIRHAQ